MSPNPTTSDKILMATIDLMAEKGYDGTTTKEIALAAGVNEVPYLGISEQRRT